jgi:hypothetical protein
VVDLDLEKAAALAADIGAVQAREGRRRLISNAEFPPLTDLVVLRCCSLAGSAEATSETYRFGVLFNW